MSKKNPSMKDALTAIETKACTWYDRCSFLYETHEGMDAINGGINFNITCSILVDGYDMNYRLRFKYRQRPGEGFRYTVTSDFGEVRCNKVTDDYNRAMAFVEMLMKEVCCRINGHEEICPADWNPSKKKSKDHNSLQEDGLGYSKTA